jgi:hypothetical protein
VTGKSEPYHKNQIFVKSQYGMRKADNNCFEHLWFPRKLLATGVFEPRATIM